MNQGMEDSAVYRINLARSNQKGSRGETGALGPSASLFYSQQTFVLALLGDDIAAPPGVTEQWAIHERTQLDRVDTMHKALTSMYHSTLRL